MKIKLRAKIAFCYQRELQHNPPCGRSLSRLDLLVAEPNDCRAEVCRAVG
jgi:hypothetical protein